MWKLLSIRKVPVILRFSNLTVETKASHAQDFRRTLYLYVTKGDDFASIRRLELFESYNGPWDSKNGFYLVTDSYLFCLNSAFLMWCVHHSMKSIGNGITACDVNAQIKSTNRGTKTERPLWWSPVGSKCEWCSLIKNSEMLWVLVVLSDCCGVECAMIGPMIWSSVDLCNLSNNFTYVTMTSHYNMRADK